MTTPQAAIAQMPTPKTNALHAGADKSGTPPYRAMFFHARRLEQERGYAIALLESAKRKHYSCEDCWYSCPKSEEGCCDESAGTECRCGVEQFNSSIDAALAALKQGDADG